MKLSRQIKPISYFKANAAEIVRQLAKQREPMVITQNGEPTAVIQDSASYEETQETMALLKILALGIRDYRQVLFGPYRLIYRVIGTSVYIYLIVDGRRDMQSLLARRLLGS